MKTYFGWSIRSNKIKQFIFGVLFMLGVVLLILYLVTMVNARKKYDDCVRGTEQPKAFTYIFNTPQSQFGYDSNGGQITIYAFEATPQQSELSLSSPCRDQWNKEWPMIVALFILILILFPTLTFPLFNMCFLTEPISSTSTKEDAIAVDANAAPIVVVATP
eukprot:TRINITY_DN3442_c2_g1_i2.p1 TRINITY_DN3442_c2_g1~~TRINITY_DN3442_c2_g1_i2.p1  ORF type:complete len:190 (+),score=13.03 TRINITY_DN3442_c2_g1_i2:87-572(+)